MSTVATYSYTHSVTYVTDNILKSLKDIIRLSGLDPYAFVGNWSSYQLAIKTWLESEHLEKVTLEIYDPKSDKLITRWDIEVVYTWSSTGDGNFWMDTEQLEYTIRKTGVLPFEAKYDMLLFTKPGRPNVPGWGPGASRSTEGMVRQSLGSTIEHNGLGGQTAYWRTR
jgi:hypothetical protein